VLLHCQVQTQSSRRAASNASIKPHMHTVSLLSGTIALLAGLSLANKSLSIDAKSNWGVWEGWGVSLAWWAKAFNRDDLATIFFSRDSQVLNGSILPGLGFNIVRYNAGASSYNTYNGTRMVTSPNAMSSRLVDGFWLDWGSKDPSSSSWDWTVDANQRAMLEKAKERGADIFELFSNSPMWWMCYNHNPSGSSDGTTANLQSWNYDSHAIYLANIAKRAKDDWGITFQSVEAFNEPSSYYWKGDSGTQEGCFFTVSTMSTVVGYLKNELASRGLSTFIAGVDETSYDLAASTWQAFDDNTRNTIKRINVHGYQGGGGRRDTLYSLAHQSGKKLWNSEYGDGDETGISLFTNMLLDFVWLHPTAWVYWQAVDISGWGLIVGDNNKGTLGTASPKFFVLAQFTRHVRPGMRILSAPDSNTMAAYDEKAKKVVIVAANWDSAQSITFDLSQFGQPGIDGSVVPRWSTVIRGADAYTNYEDTTLKGGRFTAKFESQHVQTFEVEGVVVSPSTCKTDRYSAVDEN